MRIIFMGSGAFAVPSLDALQNRKYDVALVVTQPDKPAGRGQRHASPPAANEAKQSGLPLFQPKTLKDPEVVEKLRQIKPDIIIVVSYGKLLPPDVLGIPGLGCVNVHASLLPKYRGAAPINWAIVNGETKTGVTTMCMNEYLDAGNILLERESAIADDDTSVTLHDKLAPVGAELLIETLKGLEKGVITPSPQDGSKATFAPMLKKEDGIINWMDGARAIRNLIRGMQPWPSAHTHIEGKILKMFSADVADGPPDADPGTVRVASGRIIVSTGNGNLVINELQMEGRRRMSASDFINGRMITDGAVLK